MSTVTAAAGGRMPAGVPYIVSSEFGERFCNNGINAILAVYMVQFLQVGEAQATTWQALFKSGAFLFPLLGAVVSDVLWGKFRTILGFSAAYVAGCAVLALSSGTQGLAIGLFLIAFGTGGIKPCVSTNMGDQFGASNQHLIGRAFSWLYLTANAGALISMLLCPWLLAHNGPRWAFGIPAVVMAAATLRLWLGRARFVVLPPAGRQWLRDVFSAEGARLVGRLAVVYLFTAIFWSLLDQSIGITWALQAQSVLMDKELGLGIVLLPGQISFVNALFILLLVPLFTYVVYPLLGRYVEVTALRKIGVGLLLAAGSYMVVAWIEGRIQQGIVTSVWWQILAYAILTAGEVLVSITALEYSYRQAPLRMKSFVMALYLLSISAGNLITAAVSHGMVQPVQSVQVRAGEQTTLVLPAAGGFVPGQKIDFSGDTGITLQLPSGKTRSLGGTYIVGEIQDGQAPLLDVVTRQPVSATGEFKPSARVSTYRLVGPEFFLFFSYLMLGAAVLWIFVAMRIREQTFVRQDA